MLQEGMESRRGELPQATGRASALSGRIGSTEVDILGGFRGALVGASAGIEDLLDAVEHEIMVGETIKKIPDYNIEGICQIAYQVSHLK